MANEGRHRNRSGGTFNRLKPTNKKQDKEEGKFKKADRKNYQTTGKSKKGRKWALLKWNKETGTSKSKDNQKISIINSPFCSHLSRCSWQTLAQCSITSMHKLMHSSSHIYNSPRRKSNIVLPFPPWQGYFHDFLSLTPTLILKSSAYMLRIINAQKIFKCPPHWTIWLITVTHL